MDIHVFENTFKNITIDDDTVVIKNNVDTILHDNDDRQDTTPINNIPIHSTNIHADMIKNKKLINKIIKNNARHKMCINKEKNHKTTVMAMIKSHKKAIPNCSIYKFTPTYSNVEFTNNFSDVFNSEVKISNANNITPQKDIITTDTRKKDNLVEIATKESQDVLLGKLKDIENIIGKIRVDFEDKNVFENTNKKDIILLNFEDDSTRPVLKINDKYIDIIKKWYNDCDLLIDIEETNVSMPESITRQDINKVLFNDINYKFKDDYLNHYIPLVINTIISEKNIKHFEKKYFKNSDIKVKTNELNLNEIKNNIDNTTLSDIIYNMGIIIPEKFMCKNTNKSSNTYNDDVGPEAILKIFANINDSGFIDETTKVKCYNMECNILRPLFGSTCLNITESVNNADYLSVTGNYENPNNKKSEETKLVVLLNAKFLQTIVISNPDKDVMYIIENHYEFGFIKLFDIDIGNKDIINFIEKEFDKITFNDIDEINKKLEVVSQYIDFSIKHHKAINVSSLEENRVKEFLNYKYIINNDINHKMKASVLYDMIINSNVVKIDKDKMAGFRTRLSKYLKDIGLSKKRYNDGFYYYGIVEKYTNKPLHKMSDKFDLDEIIKKRNEDLKEIMIKV